MGAIESKVKEQFLFAIVANKEGDVANFLKKYPDHVNTTLVEKTTNPICRAAYLGHKNIAALLLSYGADINLRSSDGRTPLMWAAFRNNTKMAEFLLDSGAQVDLEENEGWNALDIAVIKMNYEVALLLKRRGLQPRDKALYENNLWQMYDIDMFLQYLEEEREQVEYKRFFDLIKKQEEEWQSKDLVVDNRETWKRWVWRQLNFEDPPMIPREDLPEANQPHRSFYGKVSCFMNGVDPYPPKKKELANPLEISNQQFLDSAPLRQVSGEELYQRRSHKQQKAKEQQTKDASVKGEHNQLGINIIGGESKQDDEQLSQNTHQPIRIEENNENNV